MHNARIGSNGATLLPDRLRTLLERAEAGVWITTTGGHIVFWNRAAERDLGFRAGEVCGRACAEVLAGRDDDGRAICGPGCDVTTDTPTGRPPSFVVPTYTKDGRAVWLEVMTLTTNGHGAAPFVIHVFHDATRTKALLRELREQLGSTGDGEARLTPRELEVLRLMAAGLGTASVAERLGVSRATIRNHVQNIFGKLDVHTRLEAVAYATRQRLL